MFDEKVPRPDGRKRDLAALRREQAEVVRRVIAVLEEILDSTRWLPTSRAVEPERPCPPTA